MVHLPFWEKNKFFMFILILALSKIYLWFPQAFLILQLYPHPKKNYIVKAKRRFPAITASYANRFIFAFRCAISHADIGYIWPRESTKFRAFFLSASLVAVANVAVRLYLRLSTTASLVPTTLKFQSSFKNFISF